MMLSIVSGKSVRAGTTCLFVAKHAIPATRNQKYISTMSMYCQTDSRKYRKTFTCVKRKFQLILYILRNLSELLL
jgi:hypothetical protein